MYNDVQTMLLQSECQKYIFQQSGELNFKNFSFDAHYGGTSRRQ